MCHHKISQALDRDVHQGDTQLDLRRGGIGWHVRHRRYCHRHRPHVGTTPRELGGGFTIAMPTGVSKMLKRVERLETWKCVEPDSAQIPEPLLKLLPIRSLDLRIEPFAGSKIANTAAQIGAKLTLPDRLDRKAERDLALAQHDLHIGMSEYRARPFAFGQISDLCLESCQRRYDDVAEVGLDREIVLARFDISEAIGPSGRLHVARASAAASAI